MLGRISSYVMSYVYGSSQSSNSSTSAAQPSQVNDSMSSMEAAESKNSWLGSIFSFFSNLAYDLWNKVWNSIKTLIWGKDGGNSAQVVSEKVAVPEIDIMRPSDINCSTAWGTYQAVKRGYYVNSAGQKVKLATGEELLAKSQNHDNTNNIFSVKRFENTQITVVNQDSLEAARDAAQKNSSKVAVLMFASPTEPGGGMSEGAKAQEEDLCRRSDIFGFMWDQVHFSASKSLYPLVSLTHAHERDPNYHQKEINRMIHVPNVSVFRTAQSEGYAFLDEPFNVGMLISPAPNSPRFIKNGQATNYARQEDIDQMVKLIKTQLSIACREGYDTVILGAFGCGSFKNPTPAVAKLYHDIIDAHFKGAFKSIVFAILDDPVPMDPNRVVHNPTGNLMPFQRYFP